MKKLLKIVLWTALALVALAVLLVATLPLWLGTIARPAINAAVPKFTQTPFEIAHLSLNPYTGRFELGGFTLGNPAGYDEKVAVSLGDLVVDVAMNTLCDRYVHIEEVTVDRLFVSYVSGGEHDVDNFTQIQYNVAGGKEKYEEAKKKAELEKEKEAKGEKAEEDDLEDVSKRKFVIDRLAIRNVKLKYGLITIPIPVDIVLKDIGKESDGLTLSEIGEKIWEAILKSAGAVGDGIQALGGLVADGAGKLGEGAAKAADVVGEGASKAVDAVGEGASKAVDAVGDGAKKATDAVKKMFSL